jgi:transcriptional regulator with XRE-family HTH domain
MKTQQFSSHEPHPAPHRESAGDMLKRLRRRMGMKQKDLALISGVAQTTMSKIECGRVDPYRRTLWRLADALDTFGCGDAADLLVGDWCPHRRKNVNIC